MKTPIFWIIILVLFGVVLSFYFLPSYEELALIKLKQNKYSEAKNYYLQQYQKGNQTPDIIMALSEIYEKEGNLSEAIDLIENYAQQNPKDVSVLKYLADLYRLNQQYDDYFHTLIKINHQISDPDVLEQLIQWNKDQNLTDPLIQMLEKLIAMGKADESYYLELTYLYFLQNDYEKAYSLLQKRRHLFPKSVTLNDILFELQISSKLGETPRLKQESVELLAHFLIEKKSPQLVYIAFGKVKSQYPEFLPLFISLLKPLINNNTTLEAFVLELQKTDETNPDQYISSLFELLDKDPNNIFIQQRLFDELLNTGNQKFILYAIHKFSVKKLEEYSLINFFIYTMTAHQPFLSQEMEKALGSDYLKKNPAIAIALAMTANNEQTGENLKDLVKNHHLTLTERYYLFKGFAAAQLEKETLEIGTQLQPYINMDDHKIAEIALIYVKFKKAHLLHQMFEQAIPIVGKKSLTYGLVILDVALGNTKKVQDWLNKQEHVEESIFSDLYTTAEESREFPFALYVAKKRFHDYPSFHNEADYAFALVQTGEIDKGISIFENLYAHHKDDLFIEQNYFYALNLAAKNNPHYLDQLKSVMLNLEKRKPFPRNLILDFAYSYLDILYDYPKAKRIFYRLAKDAPAQSDVVQTYIYLHGPYPSIDMIRWLEGRAINAKPDQLGLWLDHLNFVGAHCSVITIAESRFHSLNLKAHFAYMDALVFEKLKPQLRNEIDVVFYQIQDKKQLEKLSQYAEQAEYLAARRRIWESIISKWPEDLIAWQNLAKASFDQHDYYATSEALQNLFSRYFYLYECDHENGDGIPVYSDIASKIRWYEIYYEYAEVWKKRRRYTKAEEYYLLAISQVDQAQEQTVEMLQTKSLSFFKLNLITPRFGTNNIAAEFMRQAYEWSSRNPEMTAAYANMLMDMGKLEKAGEILEIIGNE